ncbi:MAG: NCS2 family permease, partial [Alistipes sp.]|nr:NCS2 family permease [Alistipes sp.]
MLKKLFGFDEKVTTVRTEILAGVTTFLTMSYILAVNPVMFSQLEGMTAGAVFTATALAAIVGSLAMALWGKLPFGLAPGMGLNAFFVYTVCLGMGYSWQFALTAVFIEGLIFIMLTLTNLREAIVNAIPDSMKNAIGAGIGLFIAFIGLQNAGIIINNDSTLVSLGDITSGAPLLAMIGLLITGLLTVKNVRGGLLIGLLATTVIGIPMGLTDYNGVMSMPHSLSDIAFQFEWENIFTLDMVVVVFTLIFIDMFDTIGTLVGVCTKANMIGPDGRIPRV